MRIWTIGYQGFNPDEWRARLLDERIEVLADVRELPLSRRPGFSKRALAARLDEAGIVYLGIRALGAPPELRNPLKAGTMPFREFAEAFRPLLADREAELLELLRTAQPMRTCLMCWEEDPMRCHRLLVAEALGTLAEREGIGPLEVLHLRRGVG